MTNASTRDPERVERFICAVIPMVDSSRWGVPARIVAAVARLQAEADDGWAREGWRDIARRANCSPRYAWDLIGGAPGKGRLWRTDWVLVRGQVGTGRRATELRINTDLSTWRNVPWLETCAELRELRAEAALQDPLTWIWRDLDRAAKGWKWRDLDRAAKGSGSVVELLQRNGASQRNDPLSGAIRIAPQGTPLRRDLDRATTNGDPGPSTSPRGSGFGSRGVDGEDLSPAGRSRGAEQSIGNNPDTEAVVDRLVAAVNRKCQANGLGTVYRASSLVARLRRLAATGDVDAMLAGVEAAGDECGPPLVVQFLEDLATGAVRLDPAGAAPSTSLEARVANLRRLVATYAELGDDPPQELSAELARWQDELDARKELHSGDRHAQEPEPSSAA